MVTEKTTRYSIDIADCGRKLLAHPALVSQGADVLLLFLRVRGILCLSDPTNRLGSVVAGLSLCRGGVQHRDRRVRANAMGFQVDNFQSAQNS